LVVDFGVDFLDDDDDDNYKGKEKRRNKTIKGILRKFVTKMNKIYIIYIYPDYY